MDDVQQELDFSDPATLRDHWPELDSNQKKKYFWQLPRHDAEDIFLTLTTHDQAEILAELSQHDKRAWVRLLALDDVADFIQELPPEQKQETLSLLDEQTRREVIGLLAYAEDIAGGLMNPQYARLRPDVTVDAAIRYLRAQARTGLETIYYAYVLDAEQHLLGVVSFRQLLLAAPEKTVSEIMKPDTVRVHENDDREEVARLFSQNHLMAIPVVDEAERMKGIVTFDDVATIVQEAATEDIQKIGGMEVLDAPYFKVSFFHMVKKRAGWLTILFFGEMFTASAMSHYQVAIEHAVILALFIPLIISSGGNSGSQASTLIIRSMALREIRLRDWWRVMWRELTSGLFLGAVLGIFGFFRITIWQFFNPIYGAHYFMVAITIMFSLVGVVTWGTLSGSMLPFILRKLGFDPASASAPFVATLVDVTGLIIYFTVASIVLRGTLL